MAALATTCAGGAPFFVRCVMRASYSATAAWLTAARLATSCDALVSSACVPHTAAAYRLAKAATSLGVGASFTRTTACTTTRHRRPVSNASKHNAPLHRPPAVLNAQKAVLRRRPRQGGASPSQPEHRGVAPASEATRSWRARREIASTYAAPSTAQRRPLRASCRAAAELPTAAALRHSTQHLSAAAFWP